MNMKISTHNGTITVANPKTGGHKTFRVNTSKNKQTRFVSVQGQSFAIISHGKVRPFKKLEHNPMYAKLADILNNPEKGEEYGLKYLHETTCRRCNRPLTDPKSIESGIGPHCATYE